MSELFKYALAIHLCVLIALRIYYINRDKKIKANDALTYLSIDIVICILYILNMYTAIKTLLVLLSLQMFITSVGMVLLKPSPPMFKLVMKRTIDTHSKEYNKDILEFSLRTITYLILLI